MNEMCLLHLIDVQRKPLLSYSLEAVCYYCLKTGNMSFTFERLSETHSEFECDIFDHSSWFFIFC